MNYSYIMIKLTYNQLNSVTMTQNISSGLLSPLSGLTLIHYQANIECSIHKNSKRYAALFLSGEMEYRPVADAPVLCRRGDMVILPSETPYSWVVRQKAKVLVCSHDNFTLNEYGALTLLFGSSFRHIELIHFSEKFTSEFEKKLANIKGENYLELRYSAEILQLFIEALSLYGELPQTRNASSQPLAKCLDYIESNLYRQIPIEELANYCNVSPRRLFQLFSKSLKISPAQYTAMRKIKVAKRLLSVENLSNCEIAEKLGFSSANYFIRFFKKHTGKSPMKFKVVL